MAEKPTYDDLYDALGWAFDGADEETALLGEFLADEDMAEIKKRQENNKEN